MMLLIFTLSPSGTRKSVLLREMNEARTTAGSKEDTLNGEGRGERVGRATERGGGGRITRVRVSSEMGLRDKRRAFKCFIRVTRAQPRQQSS